MITLDAKVLNQQVDFYHQAKKEIIFHLVLISLCLLTAIYSYWFKVPTLVSQAKAGYLIDASRIQDPMYHPSEPIAFLTKSLSTQIHYNFLNEGIRLEHLGNAFSAEAQESIKTFLASLNLYPLKQPLQINFEAEFAPILLDYKAPHDMPYQWAYDLDFVLNLSRLDETQAKQQMGPFHLRSIISRSNQPVNGYLLQITSIVFE